MKLSKEDYGKLLSAGFTERQITTMQEKFEPVAWRFTAPGITKLDSWPHGGKWHELFTSDQLTEAYEAGKLDAIPEGWVLVPKEPIGWTHSCPVLCLDGVELWIDRCPHCGKPAAAPKGEE